MVAGTGLGIAAQGAMSPPVGPVEGAEPLWGFATVGGEISPSTAWAAIPN
jgi:hypothetical protein